MLTHRDLCVITAKWLIKQPWCDLTCWEMKYQRGVIDAIGITSSQARRDKRVTVVEVKRTRSDLLQDLRKGKMLKYEQGSSHCYLAATPEALALGKKTKAEVLADLKARGLPTHWGILLLDGEPKALRSARRIKNIPKQTIAALNRKIAKSFCYRVLSSRFTSKILGQTAP